MDGIIIINKEKNYTSHDVVYKVKKLFNQKVGHTGTLDPMATGVLPLLIGKGTLCSKYLINHDKTYDVTLELGKRTTTADGEGQIIEEKEVTEQMMNKEYIKNILKRFIGKQEQIPPIYSAIKVKGKKLYEYARKGEKVEIPSRKIEIYNIELKSINNNQLIFCVKCSKGTYIRSLCEDIAKKIGTVGYMKELNRTQVGDFYIQNSITIDSLLENKENIDFINSKIITIEDLFKNIGEIKLDCNKNNMFLNGVKIKVQNEDGIYRIYVDSQFIGIGVVENNLLKRDIII